MEIARKILVVVMRNKSLVENPRVTIPESRGLYPGDFLHTALLRWNSGYAMRGPHRHACLGSNYSLGSRLGCHLP